MRLGMFMMPVHPPGRSMSDTLREDTAKSLLADQLGFDELWMGEHFSAITEPFPSPLMFLAGLVPQTKNLSFGTATINLPNHHPAIVAAEVAQFDHMCGGRFMLGVGPGGLASDHELFGIGDGAKRGRMFLESLDHMINIWTSDPPYDIEGEFWNVKIKNAIVPELGFGAMPKPLQRPHPPIHLSVGTPTSSSAKMAARTRLGHHLGSERTGLFHRLALEDLRRRLRRGRQACSRRELARRAQRHRGADRRAGRGARVRRRHREPLFLYVPAHGGRQGQSTRHHQAASDER